MKSSSGSSFGIIIASVFLSVIIIGAGTYFGLPFLFPSLKTPDEDTNILLQMKYQEFYAYALIWDYNTTETMMNQTEMSITTNGNSYLVIEFSTLLKTQYSLTSGGFCRYRIAIVVDGVGNQTIFLQKVNYGAATIHLDETIPFSLQYKTPILSTGTYNVSIVWYSDVNIGGNSYLATNYPPAYNFSRSISVWEFLPH